MTRRSRIVAYGSLGLLIVAGGIVSGAVGGAAGGVLAIVLIGSGLVGLVGMVFMEVGLSEDRERARERGERERRERERQVRERADAEDHVQRPGLPQRPGAGRRTPFRPRRPR